MKFRILLAALLLSLSPMVAGDEEAGVEHVYITEARGTMEVAPDGSVAKVLVDEGLEEPMRSKLAARIGKLRFEPIRVGGEAVQALTGFHVVLEGRAKGEEMAVVIDSINFGTPKGMTPVAVDGERQDIHPIKMGPPEFPRDQERSGRMARLKLALRIEADGTVGDVVVLDSLLIDNGKRGGAANALAQFEKQALIAARRWTFKMPADAAARSPEELTRTTSVEYVFTLKKGVELHKQGQWLPMLRTPKRTIAWLPPEDAGRMAETAVAAGSVGGGNNAFRLKESIAGTPVL